MQRLGGVEYDDGDDATAGGGVSLMWTGAGGVSGCVSASPSPCDRHGACVAAPNLSPKRLQDRSQNSSFRAQGPAAMVQSSDEGTELRED